MSRRLISVAIFAVLLWTHPSTAQQKLSSELSEAKSLVSRKHFEEAEKRIWTVLASEPNNPAALLLLGTLRQEQRRYPEAEALARRVGQLDSGNSEAHRLLASTLLAEKKGSEALEQYLLVAKAKPDDYEVKAQIAKLYVESGKFAEAKQALDAIPDSRLPVTAIPVKAASLVGIGRMKEAASLIPRTSGSASAQLDLAEVFLSVRQPELALSSITAIGKQATRPSRYYYVKGSAELMKGEVVSAKADLQRALKLEAMASAVMMALAEIAVSERNYSEAVKLLERAHSVDPEALGPLRGLIEQGMNAGLHGTVEKAALELARKGSNPEDKYLAAAALLQEREYEIAGQLFESYVAEKQEDSKAFLGLGLVYLNQQRFTDARKALERALEINPKLTEAEYSLGVVNAKEGDDRNALVHFQKVIDAEPRHSKALLDSGTIYLTSGDLERARTLLKASEDANPSDPNTHYQLSLLFNRMGNVEAARQEMQKFRSLKQNKSTNQ